MVAADPIAKGLVESNRLAPKSGDTVTWADGSKSTWKAAKAGKDGAFSGPGFSGGYASMNVPSDVDRVMILEATGHAMVYANGEPRTGDVYGHGYVKVPVRLRKGDNEFLFRTGRGRLAAKLVAPRGTVQIGTGDSTLPDLIVGRDTKTWGAVEVINATDAPLEGVALNASLSGGPTVTSAVPTLPPLSVRKVGFRIEAPASTDGGPDRVLALALSSGSATDVMQVKLRVRSPSQTHKRTFLSGIDGSVQYFGLVPATATTPTPGLILSLHGASVEGIGQAEVYSPKPWAHVVAPTNRRPYGFDWEDWGRLDAIEVLELATKDLGTDPRKTWLTGHSMGGHGTWHLGVTFPDRFAAVAPSAGWVSMASYAGARPVEPKSKLAALLARGTSPSDTLTLAPNLATIGVYVLHGSADDNVPVQQARRMRSKLAEYHPDFAYHEQPGAGHWWGNECCDWPPLIDFLKARLIPGRKDVKAVNFVTASPGVSASCHWATVENQMTAFEPSVLQLKYDADRRRFSGTTKNVRRLTLDLGHVEGTSPVRVTLDDVSLDNLPKPDGAHPTLHLLHDGARWTLADRPSLALKGPHRTGPFKDAFRNRMVFVYGTHGTHEENAWCLAKARYDSERFWYQGNGSVDVIPDTALDPSADPDRNVIVYGHSEANSAWALLLKESPVQVNRGKLKLGDREKTGDGYACLFVRPRPGSDRASVGVVAGTGLLGQRTAEAPSYFTSGVAYPDCTVFGPETLVKGVEGVVVAGYFGEDWGLGSGEFVWAD